MMDGADHQSVIQLHSDKDQLDRLANRAAIHGLQSVLSVPVAHWPEEQLK